MTVETTSNINFATLENAADIAKRREDVLSQYQAFKDALVNRRSGLGSMLRCQHFYRDADELERWIAESMQRATDESWKEATNLEVQLQKHKTLEAEIFAHKGSLSKLDKEGGEIIDGQINSKETVQSRLVDIHHQWDELLKALEVRGIRLNQAFVLLAYLHKCDEVLYWIKDKEVAVRSTDLGHDLSHVIMLRAKYDEFVNELQGFTERVKDVNDEADKMIDEDEHPEVETIRTKQSEVNVEWAKLNDLAQQRNKALLASTEVHKFKRDVEETVSWMKEKELMVQSDDLGTDVASVQKLQRDHESIENNMEALKEKVSNLCKEADRIEEEHDGVSVADERKNMLENWDRVTNAAKQRKEGLQQRYELQLFLAESQNLLEWCDDIEARITSDELANDVAGAEGLVDKHQEHWGEIGAQESSLNHVKEYGTQLINSNHPASADVIEVAPKEEHDGSSSSSSSSSSSEDEDDKEKSSSPPKTKTVSKPGVIPERLEVLEKRHDALLQTWEDRNILYDQCLHLSLFNRDAEQAESWMNTQEALLAQNDLGDSLDSVLTLKSKHDDLTKSVEAQEEKIKSVSDVADRLIGRGHYAAEDVGKRRDALLERHACLKVGIVTRQAALENSNKLYSFLRSAHNLCSWIEEKRKVAGDESYKDLSNIRGKLQRHHMFEEEVRANDERVQSCMNEAEGLIGSDHYASDEIKKKAELVEEQWKQLQEECKERGKKLSEACAEQGFNRSVSEIHRWIDDVQKQLSSEDTGKDVSTVTSLIKKHQLLEVDVQVHKERVDGVEVQANRFVAEEHFHCDVIKEKQEDLSRRYISLMEPMTQRREKLATSLLSKQLFRDIQDEREWIQDKRPMAAATNLGKDLMSVRNLLKKHQLVQAEIVAHEPIIEETCNRADRLVEDGHFEAQQADELSNKLRGEWKKLRADASQRECDLEDSLAAHKYLANSNDAQLWISEKESILSLKDVGADEDSAESLIKKHGALMRDIESYNDTIIELRKECEECKLQCPWGKEETLERVLVCHDYRGKIPRELTVKKGETLSLVSAYNKDWWKVEADDRKGFVPSSCVRRFTEDELRDDSDDEDDVVASQHNNTLLKKQQLIEEDYENLKIHCTKRNAALEHSRRRHALARECDDLVRWMDERKNVASTYQLLTSDDDEEGGLEQVKKLQKKLDDFQKDLKAREKRMDELNQESRALDLEHDGSSSSSSSSSGSEDDVDANEDMAVAAKVKNLNDEWGLLHKIVKDQNDKLGSAHQVQKFFRDADETHDWIDEKSAALDNDNVGNDLPTVQALQRKHDGLERDLAALGERVHSLDADASRLSADHPEQVDAIQNKRSEINQAWNDLVAKAEARKRCLSDSYDLQRFLADCCELQRWLAHMSEQVSSQEVGDDIPGAESLLQRHQEHRADMDARAPSFHSLERQADKLVQAEHPSTAEIDAAVQQISRNREELEKAWASRRILLEQCLTLHLFLRDCENAENWMQAREAFLASEESGDSLDSVESLIKKHEDFDRAIGLQEAKMTALQSNAERLLESDPPHYANDDIREKAREVYERWLKLKAALIDKRSRLGETQTLQQFSRDADEAEAWIADKLQTAMDESYKDPSNIQSKHQKHQAFEAELDANKERIFGVIGVGQQLIDTHQCAGSEDAVKSRIEELREEWENLLSRSAEKGGKLKEANQQQNFVTAVKDMELWMSEVEAVLASEDVGKDVPSVSNLLKKQKLLEADVAAHEDRTRDLSKDAVILLEKANESDALDQAAVEDKRDRIEKRFADIKEQTRNRRAKLQESLKIQQILHDLADEDSWINEKKLLVSGDDTGKDLTSVDNLRKKQKRIDAEIVSHEPNIERILENGKDMLEEATMNQEELADRMKQLSEHWEELKSMADERGIRLSQAQVFHQFRADLEEESSWISEQLAVLDASEDPSTLAAAQSLLSKHETFEIDLNVHHERIADVKTTGEALIQEGNPHSPEISSELSVIDDKLANLNAATNKRRNLLRETSAFLQFNWKADVVEAWIGEKEQFLKSEEFGDDLSYVQALLLKQATFDAGLDAFEQEGVAKITSLKDELVEAEHAQSDEIKHRHSILMNRWESLRSASKIRQENLEKAQARLRGVNDLYLLFAKKASAFNSWFENVEEDLSDPVRCHSIAEIQALLEEHNSFRQTLGEAEKELKDLYDIDDRLQEIESPSSSAVVGSSNPYTWFTRQTLQETWSAVQKMTEEREAELLRELERQKENDVARQKFAKHANAFHEWLTSTRASMMEESGTLESQLEATKLKSKEIKEKKSELKEIEELGAALEEALILDNTYTEYSALGLAQKWDQLEQLGMRMQHNLEQQIQARNMTGVTEDALKEFSMMFKHFDKDKTGKLEHHEFKSCLRSLGYDLPMVEEGEEDPEFQSILDMVDPNRDGVVSLQEYMGFMISRETENVKSSDEVESAFKALSVDGKPFVTKDELYQNLSREQADYCISHMPLYYDAKGINILGAYDYVAFTKQLFNN